MLFHHYIDVYVMCFENIRNEISYKIQWSFDTGNRD